MIDERPVDPESDPIHLAAADWLLRLQEPDLSLEETLEWQRWMSAAPAHARAFKRLEELWGLSGEIQWPSRPEAQTQALENYDGAEPVSDWLTRQARQETVKTAAWRPVRVAWAAAALLLLAGAVTAGLVRMGGPQATLLETAVGDNRTFVLGDGSVIELAGGSRCEVRLGAQERAVSLMRGEALFHVAKDPRRPFRVQAGSARVVAVGTEFDVHRVAGRAVVSVLEGTVRVQTMAPLLPVSWIGWTHLQGEPVALSTGRQTTVSPAGIRPLQSIADPDTVLYWRHGRLTFEQTPLREALEDVNRYSATPIVAADEGTGALLITGTVSVSDIDGWLASLKPAFGLRAERQADRILLRAAPP